MAKQDYIFNIHEDFNARAHLLEKIELPLCIKNNLKSDFELRPYQIEALKRLYYYLDKDRDGILFPQKSNHLAYSMATGSGKTLIMAGMILYLFEKGYRNFLFFSTSRQIIEKTKHNFISLESSKYLFNQDITIDNKKVYIKNVDNFDKASDEDINICFTTINGLHSRLQNVKENQITIDDFRNYKTVIIGDEAHHFNVNTKKKGLQLELWDNKNWENTITDILNSHQDNLFFELSATFEFTNDAIYEKYKDKVIYNYDIKEFRNDGFSKEILVLQSDVIKKDLIIQALIFNQYKQEIAFKHALEIKPVILFKANKAIKESHANQELFNNILDNLSANDIENLHPKVMKSDNQNLKNAFTFFEQKKDHYRYLIDILKRNFALSKQLNTNDSKAQEVLDEVRDQEILLNSLEDENNQIRAIFTVNKLNEGWDVLNLFDIVRLYDDEIHATKTKSTTKKQTVSEAQLIGRGARYCPFLVRDENNDEIIYSNLDKYKRKFDQDTQNDLRILEELYYHSVYDSSFISSLHEELMKQGWQDDPNDYEEKNIEIKTHIAITDFWQKSLVIGNKKIKKRYDRYNLWDRLPYGDNGRNFEYKIPSGKIITQAMFDERDIDIDAQITTRAVDLRIADLPLSLKMNALLFNSFYSYDNLKTKFPKINSSKEFVYEFLDQLTLRFIGDRADLQAVKVYEKSLLDYSQFFAGYSANIRSDIYKKIQSQIFNALKYLLNDIEKKLDRFTTLYQGTIYFKQKDLVKSKFKSKTLKIRKNDRRSDGNIELIGNKDWFVYKELHGTSEEIAFVKLFDQIIYDDLKRRGYDDIYLIRNEEDYTIYDFDTGDGFCPDFILFMKDPTRKDMIFQILIEPKGKHIELKDDWKNNMLNIIKEKYLDDDAIIYEYGQMNYYIIGLPFYNSAEENKFLSSFNECFIAKGCSSNC